MTAQIITTPAGERLAIVPEAEYLVLVEALDTMEDLSAIDRFQARLAEGSEELVPASVVNALLEGRNPIRVWRELRGLTAKDLAAQAGLSQAYISQIETGEREGSLAAMKQIAQVLRLTLDDLVG